MKNRAEVFFLSVVSEGRENDDPTLAFLERFVGLKPRAAPVSESKPSLDGGACDKRTGEKGLIFRVGRIRWKSDDEVVAEGGYYENGESSSSGIYTLARISAGWTVQKEQTYSISSNNQPNRVAGGN
jgi:hypothetical protein